MGLYTGVCAAEPGSQASHSLAFGRSARPIGGGIGWQGSIIKSRVISLLKKVVQLAINRPEKLKEPVKSFADLLSFYGKRNDDCAHHSFVYSL